LYQNTYLSLYYLLPISSLYRRTTIVFHRRIAILYQRTAANNIKGWHS